MALHRADAAGQAKLEAERFVNNTGYRYREPDLTQLALLYSETAPIGDPTPGEGQRSPSERGASAESANVPGRL